MGTEFGFFGAESDGHSGFDPTLITHPGQFRDGVASPPSLRQREELHDYVAEHTTGEVVSGPAARVLGPWLQLYRMSAEANANTGNPFAPIANILLADWAARTLAIPVVYGLNPMFRPRRVLCRQCGGRGRSFLAGPCEHCRGFGFFLVQGNEVHVLRSR